MAEIKSKYCVRSPAEVPTVTRNRYSHTLALPEENDILLRSSRGVSCKVRRNCIVKIFLRQAGATPDRKASKSSVAIIDDRTNVTLASTCLASPSVNTGE